ncbi:MAG: hypothetical protein IPM54_16785 [Polyangiaceae bacterium]|nr:hypothetical protein [Polyangiaceae bacterium]
MDPRIPAAPMVLAPSAHSVAEAHTPARMERRSKPTPASFPPVDEHIVVPEVSRVELIDGREVIDVGSLPPHADAQALTGFLLAAHVLRAYVVATELLTRSSVESDFATDVCIRKRGIDPETGSRYLEELSFEIVNEQSMSDVTGKAKNLARRGVRRIFAIFVKTGEIREWSKASGEFVRLDMNAMFDDPVFVRPIAVKALVDSTLAEAENEVAKALIAKKNPEIVKLQHEAEQQGYGQGHKKGLDEGHKKGLDEGHKKGLDEGHKKGLDEGHKKGLDVGRNMLRRLLHQRFGDVPVSVGNRVDTATAEQLEFWTAQLFSAASIEELFASDSAI